MVGNAAMIEDEVLKALNTTLEEMSFSHVIRVDRVRQNTSEEKMVFAHLHIDEPRQGFLALYMPMNLASKLTEATFGILDKPPAIEMILDALGEFVNTITGCALAGILSDNETFTLGLPKMGQLDKDLSEVNGLETLWAFSIDEEPVYLSCSGEIFS